ncbi:hypothetical protein F5141DRAFT_1091196 [Pisolithus sp. B1]|nr:hypothetical protein F5141DRAFT_1091196 [Pisolithus sp. B1]
MTTTATHIVTHHPECKRRRETPVLHLRFKPGRPASIHPNIAYYAFFWSQKNQRIDMSSAASSPGKKPASKAASPGKGKERQRAAASEDTRMDEDSNDEGEDDEDDEEEDEEAVNEDMEEDEDDLDEIDPSVITGRRTRGKKVDYTSSEALAKAGLTERDLEDEEDD